MDLLTNMSLSDPSTIVVGVGIIAVIAAAGYLVWAYFEKNWPFNQ